MFNLKHILIATMICSSTLNQQLQNQPPQQQQTQIKFVEVPLDQPLQGQGMQPIVVQSSQRPQQKLQQPVQRKLTPEEQYKQEVLQIYGSVSDENLIPLYEPGPNPQETLQQKIDMPQQLPQQSYIVDPELQEFYNTYLPNYNKKKGIQQRAVMVQEDQLQKGFLDSHLESDGRLRSNQVEQKVTDLNRGVLRERYVPPPTPAPKVPYPKAPKPQIYYTRQNQDGGEEVVKSRIELERERREEMERKRMIEQRSRPMVQNTNFYESANIPGDQQNVIDTELIRYRDESQQQRNQYRGNRKSFPSNLSEDYEGRFNKIENPITVPLDFQQQEQQGQLSEGISWEEYQRRSFDRQAYDESIRQNPTFQSQIPKTYTPEFVGNQQQPLQN